MKLDFNIDDAIKKVQLFWKTNIRLGETWFYDCYDLAKSIVTQYDCKIPKSLPSKEIGLSMERCVSRNLVENRGKGIIKSLRKLDFHKLSELLRNLNECLQLCGFDLVDDLTRCALALFIRHGALNMSKIIRKKKVVGINPSTQEPITSELTSQDRWNGYCFIQEYWVKEEKDGNPWIKFGVSLGRSMFKKEDEKNIYDDWVPDESPYWKYIKK